MNIQVKEFNGYYSMEQTMREDAKEYYAHEFIPITNTFKKRQGKYSLTSNLTLLAIKAENPTCFNYEFYTSEKDIDTSNIQPKSQILPILSSLYDRHKSVGLEWELSLKMKDDMVMCLSVNPDSIVAFRPNYSVRIIHNNKTILYHITDGSDLNEYTLTSLTSFNWSSKDMSKCGRVQGSVTEILREISRVLNKTISFLYIDSEKNSINEILMNSYSMGSSYTKLNGRHSYTKQKFSDIKCNNLFSVAIVSIPTSDPLNYNKELI